MYGKFNKFFSKKFLENSGPTHTGVCVCVGPRSAGFFPKKFSKFVATDLMGMSITQTFSLGPLFYKPPKNFWEMLTPSEIFAIDFCIFQKPCNHVTM
jgi:hypothetical protein